MDVAQETVILDLAAWYLNSVGDWHATLWGLRSDRSPVPIVRDFVEETHRKRRREDQSAPLPDYSRPIILAPIAAALHFPNSHTEVCLCALDALACVLPLRAELRLFGCVHNVFLVAVCYKRQNLSFVVAYQGKLFLASHLVSDGLHLFDTWRNRLGYPASHKWPRQGVNEILYLVGDGKRTKLSTLPRGLLRYRNTLQSYRDVIEFMRSDFTQRYHRPIPTPGYALASTRALAAVEHTQRIFPRTCHADCLCRRVTVTSSNLLEALPSSLQSCKELQAHFRTFLKNSEFL